MSTDDSQWKVSALAAADIFHALPQETLARVADGARRSHFEPGDVLMREGEPSESMHVIVSGAVRVERATGDVSGGVEQLATRRPGETVGEMGLLDGDPRLATVVAVEATDTVEIAADLVADTVMQVPEAAAALVRTFSRRFRSTEEMVRDRRTRRPPGA